MFSGGGTDKCSVILTGDPEGPGGPRGPIGPYEGKDENEGKEKRYA